MSALSITPPFPTFAGKDGLPLEDGYIWLGAANVNPQTNPVAVYWDETLTQVAAQPIRTLGGYPSYAGTPARLFISAAVYSILVQDKNGSTVYRSLSNTGPSTFINFAVNEEVQVATAGQTVFTLENTYSPGTNSLTVYVDGVNQYDGAGYSFSETNGNTVTFNDGLHVGALVKFSTAIQLSGGVADASQVSYYPAGVGAVVTNVQNKLRETVSVKDFGAVGDGVTDDTAAIQAAVDAAAVVSFPYATYAITSTITVPSNRLILGQTATVKRKTGSGAFDMFQNSDQVGGNTNIKIRDLFVHGNAVADSLNPVNPTDRFSGISFVSVTGDSEVSGCTVVETINNETGAGIYVYDCSDVLVKENIGYDNNRTFIYYRNGSRNKFVRNICYNNAGSGISGKDCESAEFEGNQTYNNGSAGNFSGLNASCLRARVIGNLSYSNTGAGIAIGETSSADGSDAKVIGNICRLNTLEGIYIENSARVTVVGNQVHDNVRNNIRVRTQASYCTISGNTVNGGSGVGATGITLDGGTGHKVSGNTVSGAYSSGIYIGATVTNATVSDNTCFNNCVTSSANAGIMLQGATGCIISGNRCYDSAGAGGTQTSGIYMIGGSSNTVVNNDVSGNKTNGILDASSPIYTRRLNKIGTGVLSGSSFTAGAGATHTIANTSAQSTSRIRVWGTNAAGAALPVYVSAVTVGVDFTITPNTGSFAGTENYAYVIE